MIALFAIGVITRTVLSFEVGVLWPNFTATFGSVFGLGSPSRGSQNGREQHSQSSADCAEFRLKGNIVEGVTDGASLRRCLGTAGL
jgi:hypothetical protein